MNQPLRPHSAAWYDRLATLQSGYFYPWRSSLATGNGEDAYLALVQQYLRSNSDVLDVACGHGQLTLDLAPACRSIVAYDRVPAFIELAQRAAAERTSSNVRFVCADSSPEANAGRPSIPASDRMFDLVICRRGPFHWVEDGRRVARPGARLIMLVPNPTPATAWSSSLPAPLGWSDPDDPVWARDRLNARLAPSGLAIESYWTYVVPEVFSGLEELYRWRAWGFRPEEVPPLEAVRPLLERIFVEFGDSNGVAVPHSRFLWTATIPSGHR
jgi:SAM-dependent methyltransferase